MALANPGMSPCSGTCAPGRLDLISMAGRTPKISRSFVNPDPTDSNFASHLAVGSDVDGDGKPDIIVGGKYDYVVYGR